MAGGRDRRKQKQQQKHKVRRAKKQAQRRARERRRNPGLGDAAGWPLGDAWISEDWHDWETTVHGVAVREHAEGGRAWVAVSVDLAEGTILDLDVGTGPEGELQRRLMTLSEDKTLVGAEASAVARLLEGALTHGASAPRHLADARALLHDVDADDSPWDYRWGFEDEREPTEEVPRGVVSRLTGWLTGR